MIIEEKISKPNEIPIFTYTDGDVVDGKSDLPSCSKNNAQRLMYIMLEREEPDSDVVLCKIEANLGKSILLITPDFNDFNNRTYSIKDSNGKIDSRNF